MSEPVMMQCPKAETCDSEICRHKTPHVKLTGCKVHCYRSIKAVDACVPVPAAPADAVGETPETGRVYACCPEDGDVVGALLRHGQRMERQRNCLRESFDRERQRADFLQSQLVSWQSAFETGEPSRAKARIEQAEKDRDAARAALMEVIEEYASKGWWTTGTQESCESVIARWRKAAGMEGA